MCKVLKLKDVKDFDSFTFVSFYIVKVLLLHSQLTFLLDDACLIGQTKYSGKIKQVKKKLSRHFLGRERKNIIQVN